MSFINLNQINIIDSSPGAVALDGSIPIAVQVGDNIWSSNYKKGIFVPSGSTVERFDLQIDGYFRYNTDLAEFEGFTNSDWRPIGQLTINGTNSAPSRSFISDSTTGSYLISTGNYGIAAGGVGVIQISAGDTTISNDLFLSSISAGTDTKTTILSPTTKIGKLAWSDTVAEEAYIQYNHLTDTFEFTAKDPDIAFSIRGSDNKVIFLSPVEMDSTLTFGGGLGPFATVDGTFTSTGGFIFIIDDDSDDTTSVFKVRKHNPTVDTGFQVNQDGQVTAGNGTVSAPGFVFAGDINTGFYLNSSPAALAASFGGIDKLHITNLTSTFFNDLLVPDGLEATPSLAFSADTNTGIFRPANDAIAFSTNGIERFRIDNTGVSISLIALFGDGLAANPSIAFVDDTNTGIFRIGSDNIGIATGGIQRLNINANNVTTTVSIIVPVGTSSSPSYQFVGDTNTGLYQSASDEVSISTGGTQQVEVSNSSTTIKNKLTAEDGIFAGSGIGDMEITVTQLVSLLANQTDTAITAPLTYTGSTYEAVIVDYLVQRDVGSAVGTLYIVNDGTNVSITDTNANVNNTGIIFTATIITGTVQVKYTSTAGNTAMMKYIIRRWGI